MHFKSKATFLAKSANEKIIRSVDERWHLRSANSASITSPSHVHWPCGRGDIWVRACNVWLPQGPSYSMNVVVHIGKQRLCKPRDCHQILTSYRTVRQRQNDDLRFCLRCEKCEWWGRRERAPVNFLKESFADEEICRDWYRIEHAGWWLDQRVAILGDQPLCSDELDDQLSSLLCQLIHQQLFSRSLQQRWLLRSGLGPVAHVLIDEHASRARPSSAVAVFEIE